jgi:hypothetical protein
MNILKKKIKVMEGATAPFTSSPWERPCTVVHGRDSITLKRARGAVYNLLDETNCNGIERPRKTISYATYD